MASKRKSTTPCMIPLKALALDGGTDLAEEEKDQSSTEGHQNALPAADLMGDGHDLLTNGHENVEGLSFFCKYCNFGSQETSPFVEHMNTKHLDFKNDPSYVCIACSFLVKDPKELEAHNADSHPGDPDLSWTVAKHESYTVVEQSVSGHGMGHNDPVHHNDELLDDYSEVTITKTPIMKNLKNKLETKKMITVKDNGNGIGEESERRGRQVTRNGTALISKVTNNIVNSSPIVNGPIIGTVPVLQTGVTQLVSINPPQSVIQPKIPATIITPVLPKQSAQKSQSHLLPNEKSLPKVMIPLSSIPTYNSSMDSNCFLKNSFNKFPYPTKAELCYLTVVTKYPEEQIKIWFTAQRLKQGISWSPEEIEDSRKKMFNTIIQSIPQPLPQPTITVLNAPLVTNANNVQQLIQATLPSQIVSQPQGTGGVIVTQPILSNGIQGAVNSVSLGVAPLSTSQSNDLGKESFTAAGNSPPITSQSSFYESIRIKKSRQQLSALKNSFCKSQFPSHGEVARLTKITGLSTREVRKWFSDKRYHFRNKPASYVSENSELLTDPQTDSVFSVGKEHDTDFALPPSSHTPSHTPTHTPRRQSWHQTPDFTTTRYKERAPEQLRALESSFALSNFPSDDEVTRLRTETKMTRREIDSWFSDKRKRAAEELKREKTRFEKQEDLSPEETEAMGIKSVDEVKAPSSPVMERKVNPIKINLKALRVTDTGNNADSFKDDNSNHSDGGSSSRPCTPQKSRSVKKTAQQRDHLRQLFVKTQWPSQDQYDYLVEQTGLPRPEIVRWFGDARYSYKIGNLRWYEGYKKTYSEAKPVSQQPLLDYSDKHPTLCESDINDLCDQTGMSSDKVRSWFAERKEEAKQDAVEEGGDHANVSSGDTEDDQNRTHDQSSKVSENGESWESRSHESLPEQPPSDLPLETD